MIHWEIVLRDAPHGIPGLMILAVLVAVDYWRERWRV